jgi:hypothetical protein
MKFFIEFSFFERLISNGQLEFVAAGWVMPDEANTHYWILLTQLWEGHQVLYCIDISIVISSAVAC